MSFYLEEYRRNSMMVLRQGINIEDLQICILVSMIISKHKCLTFRVVPITSVNFIPKLIAELKTYYPMNMNKVNLLALLFSMRLLKSHLSYHVQKKSKSGSKQTLEEF